jgi:hypothetical protein
MLALYSVAAAILTPTNFALAMLSYWLPDPFKFYFGAMFCVLGVAWAMMIIAFFGEVHEIVRRETDK